VTQLLSPDFATGFLHSVRGLLPVAGVSYYTVDDDGRPSGHRLDGLALDHLHEYRSLYHRLDPLHPSRFRNPGEDVVTLERARERLDAAPYIDGFLDARGYSDEVELFFRDSGGAIVSGVGLFRHRRDGRFQTDEISLLNKVRPVLELAVRSHTETSSAADRCAAFSVAYHLTKREIEIVELLGHGASNRELADRLGIAVATVKAHLFNIFKKTGTASRTDLLSRLLSR
jgi:DNA-binding CsgD family transcriptional regulator